MKIDPAFPYAVYGYYPERNKQMVSGWNRRVFNRIDAENNVVAPSGKPYIEISPLYDQVVLQKGIYQIQAMSMTFFLQISVRHPSDYPLIPPGYAALRDVTSNDLLASGSFADPVGGAPSFVDTLLEITEETTIALEHLALVRKRYRARDSFAHLLYLRHFYSIIIISILCLRIRYTSIFRNPTSIYGLLQ
jgi:hypothetical protein